LRDLVEPRPLAERAILAEAGDGRIDDTGIFGLDRLVVDAEPLFYIGAIVLDYDVGAGGMGGFDVGFLVGLVVVRERVELSVVGV
jgi:hypothetical protein